MTELADLAQNINIGLNDKLGLIGADLFQAHRGFAVNRARRHAVFGFSAKRGTPIGLILLFENNLALQVGMFLLGVLVQSIASAVYIGVDAGAGPRDSLMLAIHRITGFSVRVARGTLEVIVVTIGWLLGGPVGWGTLAFALLIGPSVQWAFKLFKVKPHQPEADIIEAAAE